MNTGIFKAPSTGIFGNDYAAELKAAGHSDEEILKRITARDIELTKEAEEVSYRVFAIDAKTGKVKWQNEAHKGLPPGGRHRKNTYASETPATDGERLYASFGGNVGLFGLALDGSVLWRRTWEPQSSMTSMSRAAAARKGTSYQAAVPPLIAAMRLTFDDAVTAAAEDARAEATRFDAELSGMFEGSEGFALLASVLLLALSV